MLDYHTSFSGANLLKLLEMGLIACDIILCILEVVHIFLTNFDCKEIRYYVTQLDQNLLEILYVLCVENGRNEKLLFNQGTDTLMDLISMRAIILWGRYRN